MFAFRGIAVCLSVFALLYLSLSLAVCASWPLVFQYGQKFPARRRSNLLFACRMFPLAAAAMSTLVFAVPSFLLLEPRAIDEPLGLIPMAVGLCGLCLIAAGAANALRASIKAWGTIAHWQSGVSVERSASALVLRISQTVPALVAAGILRPRVFLSHRAEFVLTPKELETALQHELVHVQRMDNLRKLLMCVAIFPGMAALEGAWREASEMAADDAAVSSVSEALDLAAALIKLSRLSPLQAPGELHAALVQGPAASVNARVERLIAWNEPEIASTPAPITWYSVTTALAVALALAATYSHLLAGVHEATEWLVR